MAKRRYSAHIVLRDEREECRETLSEVTAKSIREGGNEVAGGRDEHRVIFGLVFWGLLLFILIWVLLAYRFLVEDLVCDGANRLQT